jgi:hypothetical protein
MRRYSHWWLDRCFLYVGRIAEVKGVPQILQAWFGLADDLGPDCPPLWLVGGDIQEIESVRRAVGVDRLAPYEADRRVQWWGYLDAAGISAVMLKAYVLITHSLYEPGGRVVLEALAQGIPVISTPHGFARDLVVDWHNGFLVDYGDVAILQARMAHFALQPLLGHAMGRRAHAVAEAALGHWSFIETHLRVYDRAFERDSAAPKAGPQVRIVPSGPPPQGFAGAYPFEAEIVDIQDVAAFFRRSVGLDDAAVRELPHATGRSRLWLVRHENNGWIIKHAFSTYRKRPMWDRGFGGQAAELQRDRITGEVLGAQARGAAPLVAADPASGLILREWVAPAPNARVLVNGSSLLAAFHASAPPGIDFESVRAHVDRSWRAVPDEDVIAWLAELEAHWRSEQRSWHAWVPMSLRLGWRWLELGLGRNWLALPAGVEIEARRRLPEEGLLAAEEERRMSFGLCHGDADPAHFRMREDGALVLIDCERCHPGFFGHDWARVILHLLRNTDQTDTRTTLDQAFQAVDRMIVSPRMLLSWLRWSTLMQLCRASRLAEVASLRAGLRIWEHLERLETIR